MHERFSFVAVGALMTLARALGKLVTARVVPLGIAVNQRALVDADGTLVAPRARFAPEQLGVMAIGAALVCAVVVSEVVEARL